MDAGAANPGMEREKYLSRGVQGLHRQGEGIVLGPDQTVCAASPFHLRERPPDINRLCLK